MPEHVLLKGYTSYIKSKIEMILSDNEVTTIINQIEKHRLTANSKTRREHIEHINTIKESKRTKATYILPKKNISPTTKKSNNLSTDRTPITNYLPFKGNNIGHIPLPGFDTITINLPNSPSNKCSICGTTVIQYMLEYCLNKIGRAHV